MSMMPLCSAICWHRSRRCRNCWRCAPTANPRPVLRETALIGANTGLPQTLQSKLTIAGVTQSTVLTTNMSTPLATNGTALNGTINNRIVQAGIADATALPSGSYSYSFLTIAKFGCSAVASQAQGTFVVNNQSQSAFGPGWQLAELQKLTPQTDGFVIVTEGTGRAVVMQPQQAPSFLPNPVFVPINGPFRGAVADLQGSGRKDIMRLGWKDGTFNVILNKGNRQFAKTTVLPMGQPGTANADGTFNVDASDITFGDVVGGGKGDIAVILSQAVQAQIYYGNGGGTFQPQPALVNCNYYCQDIVIGDWTGVGTNDLMQYEGDPGSRDYHAIYNDGHGHFYFQGRASPQIAGYGFGILSVRFPGFRHDSFVGIRDDGTLGFAYTGKRPGADWSRYGQDSISDWYAHSFGPESVEADQINPRKSSYLRARLVRIGQSQGHDRCFLACFASPSG